MNKPYIICAAIWYNGEAVHNHQPKNIKAGYVVAGRRHSNCITTHYILSEQKTTGENAIQGFLTSDNKFVDRKEAALVAFESGQIKKQTDCLMSEDLY